MQSELNVYTKKIDYILTRANTSQLKYKLCQYTWYQPWANNKLITYSLEFSSSLRTAEDIQLFGDYINNDAETRLLIETRITTPIEADLNKIIDWQYINDKFGYEVYRIEK